MEGDDQVKEEVYMTWRVLIARKMDWLDEDLDIDSL